MVSACGGDDGDGGHVHEIEIPAGHPRLWFSTPALLQTAKDAFAAKYGADGAGYKVDADAPLTLAYGYLMTKNKAWADMALAWAVSVQDHAIDDPDPGATVSDPYRYFGEEIAIIYDWCHDAMSSDQKSALLGRWNEYVTNENARTFGGLEMQSNNYYWGHLRNSLEWGIVTSGENDMAPGFVTAALDDRWTGSFIPFAKDLGAGGVPQEGTEYGQYNIDYPVVPFATATALGRDIYKETDFFLGSVLYIAYASSPSKTAFKNGDDGGYQMFGFDDDQAWKDGHTAERYGVFLQNAAIHYHDKPIGKLARHLLLTLQPPIDDWASVLDQRFDNDEMDASGLPLDYFAPGPGYLYARNAWGETATSTFFQLGQPSGVGHHHQDYGTFQIWRNGRWLSRESASYNDAVVGWDGNGGESAADTIAHNGILFEGIGNNSYFFQDAHVNTCDGPPVVLRLESKDAYTYAAVDLSKSYRSHGSTHTNDNGTLRDDNAHVKTIIREFVFVRELEALVVFDRLESSAFDRQDAIDANGGQDVVPHVNDPAAVRKTFLAHFETQPTIAGNVATASYGNQTMRVITAYPTSGTSAKVIDETGDGGSAAGQYRLEVTTSGAAQSYFIHVLAGEDAGGDAVSANVAEDVNGFTLTVSRGGTTKTVKLAKGMTSTGGSLDGSPFTTAVQGIAVDTSGPHWR